MADEIELPPYPVGQGHILAEQRKNGRGRLTSQMAALDDELAILWSLPEGVRRGRP